MNLKPTALFLSVLAVIACGRAGQSQSPFQQPRWTDARLTARNGLILWLDCAAQQAGRQEVGKSAIRHGDRVELLLDGSGHGRHLVQDQGSSQPTYQITEALHSLRFDGRRTSLTIVQVPAVLKDCTIFVVAAPFSNQGFFRGFLAFNETGKNDYVSGLTLDLGPLGMQRFQALNPEGIGFGGAVNLMRDTFEFGTLQRICMTTKAGRGGTRLYINGNLNGQRDRSDGLIHLDRITLGARFYAHGAPPETQGYLHGHIAEVLVYDRVLPTEERAEVEKYLIHKYGDAPRFQSQDLVTEGKPLRTVADPPPVQVLVPGFTVRQLPVSLTNINNVQYRPDGKLVALAYDGNVYLLSDTDGDGLEDRVELFWDNKGRLRSPIGMALTPPGYKLGQGLFVASKGKCSLIVDTDGDGRADQEIIVATGWKELPHNVDALGVDIDPKDGSVYFGLGTTDYTNAYMVGKDGKARFDLASERGTILRVAPDFKSRAIMATGIRFPVGIRFNAAGDLFCTDQEGATWLPNGNPLDELLHIQQGRHYGFPPRHPRHLPNVVDEPSTVDYGPQHQSTCGLNFNEPVHGGPVLGPAWWRSDALVTGYSRGKLYRTTLVKTQAGYLARNQLLANLGSLPCDACVSPRGDLVVAVHSGGPDWGSGPSGKGKLYKISYEGKDLPQPVLAWSQGPQEIRIAFDRPLDPTQLHGITAGLSIEFGTYVSAGDRFEQLRPGYQVVQDQMNTPRHELPVRSLQVTGDRRTLVLVTAPQTEAVNYAITLPGLGRPQKPAGLPQVPETDLRYDLTGVEASWVAAAGEDRWHGWLPHLDLAVSRRLTMASGTHDSLWHLLDRPGRLTLRTQLVLKDLLRPAVQPGARIDYSWPEEHATLTFRSRAEIRVQLSTGSVDGTWQPDGTYLLLLTAKPGDPLPIEISLLARNGRADLDLSYHTKEDSRPRALPLHRMLLPWARTTPPPEAGLVVRKVPELEGGSWSRGRDVFLSDQAACSRCHRIGATGGNIGPDLSNLAQRDYHSVLRDISDPSYAIHPDYFTQVVALKDGRVLTGSVRSEGEMLHVGDKDGKVVSIHRGQVESMTATPRSVMPEGMPKLLGPEKMRDLLTFLLSDAPRMPDYGPLQPPEPRTLQEVQAILAGAKALPPKLPPLKIVLVAGAKDHGPGEHDYPAWQKVWQKLLAMAEGIEIGTSQDWPTADQLRTAQVIVFFQQGKWTPNRNKDLDDYLARGGGLVYLHYAVDGGKDAPGFAQRIGLAWQAGSRFRHGPLDLGFESGSRHPIARNFNKVHFHDESYWRLAGDPRRIQILASGKEDGEDQPLFWTLEPSHGRVFVSILGHYSWTFDDPLFRILVLRGIAWAAREPVDRLNDLVLPGARVKNEK